MVDKNKIQHEHSLAVTQELTYAEFSSSGKTTDLSSLDLSESKNISMIMLFNSLCKSD